MATAAVTCHLCSGILDVATEFSRFTRVTSDCKPWPPGGILGWCQSCGLVQTVTSPTWQREADEIYRGYAIYHQSGGAEQSVFVTSDRTGSPRSEVIVRALHQSCKLPHRQRHRATALAARRSRPRHSARRPLAGCLPYVPSTSNRTPRHQYRHRSLVRQSSCRRFQTQPLSSTPTHHLAQPPPVALP